jgi:glutamate-1-semialdehyde 2,1-aminomutase
VELSWNERARRVIAQGCNVYSKRSDQFVEGVYPTHVVSSQNCTLYCDNGKPYIDMSGGLGSNILDCSNNFTLPHVNEVVLCEMIRDRIPFVEKMRLGKNGSDACQAAVRIARAHTKRSKGYGTGYHGSLNWCIAAEKPGAGCVNEGYTKFTNLDALMDRIRADREPVAYVIVEPVELDWSNERREKLCELRGLCTERGIALIFDEVITGFRVPQYCIALWWGIEPDLICFGKPIANGHPVSVVGGRAAIMDTPDYFISYTFAGELTSINAAIETLTALTPGRIRQLWDTGAWFQGQFADIAKGSGISIVGYPTRAVWQGDALDKALFWQGMADHGVLCGKAMFINLSHSRSILSTVLAKAEIVLKQMRDGKITLRGSLPKEVFKRNEEAKA